MFFDPIHLASLTLSLTKTPASDNEFLHIPDANQLASILGTVYRSSFLAEEAKSVTFRLLLARKAKWNELVWKPYCTAQFVVPLPFTASSLAKLSPASNWETGIICLDPELLEIWAIATSGRSWLEMAVGKSGSSYPQPPGLTLSVEAPGNLKCAIGSAWLWQTDAGEIVEDKESYFSDPHTNALFAMAEHDALEEVKMKCTGRAAHLSGQLFRYNWSGYLKYLLHSISIRRHGGTLLIYKNPGELEAHRKEEQISVLYDVQNSEFWTTMVEHHARNLSINNLDYHNPNKTFRAKDMNELHSIMDWRIHYNDRQQSILEYYTDLANVDGALLISPRFELLGFGAKLKPKQRCPEDVVLSSKSNRFSSDSDTMTTSSWGTRHQSAAAYVMGSEKVLAFVISQDGPITLFYRDASKVFSRTFNIPVFFQRRTA